MKIKSSWKSLINSNKWIKFNLLKDRKKKIKSAINVFMTATVGISFLVQLYSYSVLKECLSLTINKELLAGSLSNYAHILSYLK